MKQNAELIMDELKLAARFGTIQRVQTVRPITATAKMTQPVGVNGDGRLFTTPTGAAGVISVNGQTGAVTLDAESLGVAAAVKAALTEAKASGEFDGKAGYTPQKGTDYFTAEDKAELVEVVLSNFIDASEVAL